MLKTKDKKTEYRFDIFEILKRVNEKDRSFLNSLEDDDKKHVNPYMIMRWMSGSNDPTQIIFLNELVNRVVWGDRFLNEDKLGHFNILIHLLTICGTGKNVRFSWIKTNSEKKKPMSRQVVMEYFQYNSADAAEALEILTKEDVADYAEQLGYQVEHVKKLKKEWT